MSTEKANALQSVDRLKGLDLSLPTSRIMLSIFATNSSLRAKLNDNGKSDYSFWLSNLGKESNILVAESQQSEITPAQQAEALKLAESGMDHQEIAQKLGVTQASVYYTIKGGTAGLKKKSKKPRKTALFTFDKEGNLVAGRSDSMENTVRLSSGSADNPLLFFVLRDSYSRVGGARFVISACNDKQFSPETLARVVIGVTQSDNR